uniref:uncharacterized J domain-containing protein C4H3.01 n=1 Tax=Erigeron canadensis TaxID=72917 RepID=UPI001CB91EE1|nr:uncharacterized J domain-containing protein C4H3.01 [Erigeron canadensis]
MSNLRTTIILCRPQHHHHHHRAVVTTCCNCCSYNNNNNRFGSRTFVSNKMVPKQQPRLFSFSPSSILAPKMETLFMWGSDRYSHQQQRRKMVVRAAAANWTDDNKSPYATLEVEGDADDEQIKLAYRRLAKFYHPDVYDGRGSLEEGETAEARFIKIQAAYELLIDSDERRKYDMENRVNPMKASQAWMEWLMKKRKAFDQRGDMAIAAWAEQQQRELNIRVRRMSRSKIDPDEERRILAKEKKASMENYNNTLKRHTLVLRKRDLMRKKAAEESKKLIINKLLAAEGLELASDEDDAPSS